MMLAAFLAVMALAMHVPDVPSGAGYHELNAIIASGALPGVSDNCAQIDLDAGIKQKPQLTDGHKHSHKHHHRCCRAGCSVFGAISSPLVIPAPGIVRIFSVPRWPTLSPADPQDLQRPPKRLA
ncbi:hypothetical protein PY650_13040 [Rhizobium calliandrae]|uniref:DUF2946 domain-containing protein n=1 Tax=Rhizobium calliandrae TaxID=1312182 RepID=A0ABT7KD76_9HYPH|nr:hypothetical protein [Rhizobium calliandrae]MDL2406570.1 hypothetical protein [Rhizobium calliandrae]